MKRGISCCHLQKGIPGKIHHQEQHGFSYTVDPVKKGSRYIRPPLLVVRIEKTRNQMQFNIWMSSKFHKSNNGKSALCSPTLQTVLDSHVITEQPFNLNHHDKEVAEVGKDMQFKSSWSSKMRRILKQQMFRNNVGTWNWLKISLTRVKSLVQGGLPGRMLGGSTAFDVGQKTNLNEIAICTRYPSLTWEAGPAQNKCVGPPLPPNASGV